MATCISQVNDPPEAAQFPLESEVASRSHMCLVFGLKLELYLKDILLAGRGGL